jgi:hypothetical protein
VRKCDYTALGPACRRCKLFQSTTAIGMATTVTADDTSVTFTTLDGQVVTFSEYSTNATFTGTDINNGGCAAGDRRGTVTFDTPCGSGPIVPALKNAGHTDRRQ